MHACLTRTCAAAAQVSVVQNTEGFVLKYNGAVLSSDSSGAGAQVSVPGPKGGSTHFYITVECGYKPIRELQVGLLAELACQLLQRVTCQQGGGMARLLHFVHSIHEFNSHGCDGMAFKLLSPSQRLLPSSQ